MHRYHVVDLEAEDGMCVLQSSASLYHVARPLGSKPALNAVLHGDKPHLGFGILVCKRSDAVFRVIFESINGARPALRSTPHATVPMNAPHSSGRSSHAAVGSDD